MNSKSKMLNAKIIARRLELSLQQVYNLLKKDSDPIPHYRIGGSYRIPEDEFERWLEEHWHS